MRAQVELQDLGVGRPFLAGAEKPHAPRDRLHHVGVGGAVGHAQVVDRRRVDREESQRRAVFGGHVGDGGAVRDREVFYPRAEVLDELFHDTALAQHLGHGQHEVGRGDALPQAALQAHADHLGNGHVVGLAQHDGLGLDAAHAPAHDADPVDHGGVGVEPHDGVRVGPALPVGFSAVITRPMYSRFTWWQMPEFGGTTRKLSKLAWAHLSSA